MLFKELKQYFEQTELPKTLDGGHKYYNAVRKTADLYLFEIELALSDGSKPNSITRNTKDKLVELYNDLQIKENWNAPMKTLSEFNNKMV